MWAYLRKGLLGQNQEPSKDGIMQQFHCFYFEMFYLIFLGALRQAFKVN